MGYVYGAITIYGGPFQATSTSPSGCGRALQPHISARFPAPIRFRLIPLRSPLLRESHLVSLPPPTWMFPFGGFSLLSERHVLIACDGKSHSGISGSKAACAYPEHIAACHALLQRPSRAIRQVAYHARPKGNPHSISV